MKKQQIAMIAMTSLLGACTTNSNNDETIITRPEVDIVDGQYTVDALEAMGRVSSPVVSPDGSKVLYGISYESVALNKSNNELWIMNLDGSDATQLTSTPKSESNAVWIDGGKRIAFLYDGQIWAMNADGSGRTQLSDVAGGIQGFSFSPDQKHVVMICSVKYARTAQDVYPDLPDAT
ncbi:MAG: peptidase S9, partial [Muribaculaceae bacterium]|nr:peptidase S9 [Muribaculaceae bacterium]